MCVIDAVDATMVICTWKELGNCKILQHDTGIENDVCLSAVRQRCVRCSRSHKMNELDCKSRRIRGTNLIVHKTKASYLSSTFSSVPAVQKYFRCGQWHYQVLWRNTTSTFSEQCHIPNKIKVIAIWGFYADGNDRNASIFLQSASMLLLASNEVL